MIKKICLLTDSLGSGGAERMVSNLSISLSEKGYQVCVVSMMDNVVYPYRGKLFNFGEVKKNNSTIGAFFKFRAFFKAEQFDVVIDHRVRRVFLKEWVFSKTIFSNTTVIYCIHHYDLSLYFPLVNMPWLSKQTFVKNRALVAVSQEVKNEIKKRVDFDAHLIYNYVLDWETEKVLVSDEESHGRYIVGVGRLTTVKQFDVLIKSYKDALLQNNSVKLLILGEGEEKERLENLISSLNLNESVKLLGFKENIKDYVKHAMALVLSSKSEGYPMVLIEALNLKTPVISFDCKSGPSEIIKHNKNGLLVENQNPSELTKSLNKLLDEEFYKSLKSYIEDAPNPFNEETIINQWLALLNNLNKKNRIS